MLRRVLIAVGIVLAALTSTAATIVPAGATPRDDVSVAAPCPYSGIHPVLMNGSDGGAVRHLQCLLNKIWGYGEVAQDGHFGPITESAVTRHQQDCQIQVDGVVGPETWRHLHPDTTTDQCRD